MRKYRIIKDVVKAKKESKQMRDWKVLDYKFQEKIERCYYFVQKQNEDKIWEDLISCATEHAAREHLDYRKRNFKKRPDFCVIYEEEF